MIPLYALQGEQRRNFLVEYLVIGGGGSGGIGAQGSGSGGGGAGGYRSSVVGELSGRNSTAESRFDVTQSTTYTVTIGAGGPRLEGQGHSPTKGNSSTFATITALGGGGGITQTLAGISPPPGFSLTLLDGGSGGGSAFDGQTGTSYSAGTGATGQGFGGGTGASDGVGGGIGGGGGGAGQAGSSAIISAAGKGGDGISSSITGTSVTRAGGGGGGRNANLGPTPTPGAGGAGGGGSATSSFTGNGDDGSANTGGGGGATNPLVFTTSWSGAGGSGVVIVRYPVSRLINLGPGLTGTTSVIGNNKVTIITAGTGQVSWV